MSHMFDITFQNICELFINKTVELFGEYLACSAEEIFHHISVCLRTTRWPFFKDIVIQNESSTSSEKTKETTSVQRQSSTNCAGTEKKMFIYIVQAGSTCSALCPPLLLVLQRLFNTGCKVGHSLVLLQTMGSRAKQNVQMPSSVSNDMCCKRGPLAD